MYKKGLVHITHKLKLNIQRNVKYVKFKWNNLKINIATLKI